MLSDNCASLYKCITCGTGVEIVLELPNKYVLGMADEYIQQVAYCPKCKLLYTANPFNSTLLADRYKLQSKFDFQDDTIFEEPKQYLARAKRQKYFIENKISDFTSILEVGAASGLNLSQYPEKKRLGIEPSSVNCEYAEQQYGLGLYNGMFEEFIHSGQTDTFDLVFLSHVLEHITKPYEFLMQLRDINNHYCFIEVPTIDYKFVDEPFGLFCEEHVNYFSFESLNFLMNLVGYQIVDLAMIFEYGQNLPAGWPALSTLWRKVPPNEKIKQLEHVNSGKRAILSYIDCSRKELTRVSELIDLIPSSMKLAVWGTGHHMSMLLGNTNLAKKNIVKFYDSDRRKHHLQIDERHITSFNPQDLSNGVVEGILVATYTAQSAIMKSLAPYNKSCNIFTLYDL